MKKIIIFFFLLITSCSVNTTNSIEGSWIRQGTIEYKNGKPIDTVNFDGIYFEVYSKSSY